VENELNNEINNSENIETSKEPIDLDNYEYYINKELSWLDFNLRVLDQAFNKKTPILERLKFLSIFSSNLDEFFMIRVAGLKQQILFDFQETGPDRMSPTAQLIAISKRTHEYVRQQYHCYNTEIKPALAKKGINILNIDQINKKQEDYLKDYWDNTIFPILTPLAVDPSHPFPHLANRSLNLVVELRSPETSDNLRVYFAFVQVPKVIKRLIQLPYTEEGTVAYVLLEELINKYIKDLFPGLEIFCTSYIRVTRNSDLSIVEEEAIDLLKAIQEEVRRRKKGNIVRLEMMKSPSKTVLDIIIQNLNIDQKDIYEINGPLNITDFMELYNLEEFSHLKDVPYTPYDPLAEYTEKKLFSLLRRRDILLYHPYDSFQGVIDFIEYAAEDPDVLAIKQTLYRTGKESPFVDALIKAAENGKQVTALVEIKARFDEEFNINWAKKLEDAGVNVVYGLVGLKTHCKMAIVIRKERNKIRRYVHLSTGNYNPQTAKLYSDIGLFTSNKNFSQDVLKLFNVITGYSNLPPLKKIFAAPINMREEVEKLIMREKQNKEAGKKGKIILKMNSIADLIIMQALYKASMAGVEIDLIIRGICCLIPGIKGLSENIKVHSILDRFLEHSRILYFYNDGKEEVYLSSADLRARNLERRVEVMFPIETENLKHRIINEMLLPQMKDNTNRYELNSDGKYYLKTSENELPFSYQKEMIKLTNIKKSQSQVPLQGISSEFIKKKKKKKK